MTASEIIELHIREIERYWHLVDRVDVEIDSGIVTTKTYRSSLEIATITMYNGKYLSCMINVV